MKDFAETTLASLVISNHQVVPVLEKYNLDFCCGGKQTLAKACQEKSLSVAEISEQLALALAPSQDYKQMPFIQMSAEQLISHILIRHHFYLKQSMPQIAEHLKKVASKHGLKFPYMIEVYELFLEVQNDMSFHMEKEEKILFPAIKNIHQQSSKTESLDAMVRGLANIIDVMEREHESAGNSLAKIKQLTNHYELPEGACTTFKVSLAELREFEEDLHQHVHLENNILFPAALRIKAS